MISMLIQIPAKYSTQARVIITAKNIILKKNQKMMTAMSMRFQMKI